MLLVAGPLALRGDEVAVRGVSPGAGERVVEATSACPSFSWSAVEGASGYRLALFETRPDGNVEPVYSQRIEGAAFSWTPPRERCLAPGREYAWVVRAERGSAEALGAWSSPLRFRVPGTPSEEEVRAALELLGRWRAGGRGAAGGGDSGVATETDAAARSDREAGLQAEASTATGVAAIRGEIADVAGNAYGVFGISHSSEGAGVVARNESAGADLILDGEAQGQADTLLTESGIDRPSATAQTFEIGNSGAGAMALTVDGVEVDTAATPIGWTRLTDLPPSFADGVDDDTTYAPGNQLELVGSTFHLLEGTDSGLDADTLDGLQGTAFAPASHAHVGEQIVAGTVAEPRIAAEIARDDEVFPIVLASDGAGSGLDADTLDGGDSSAFQARVSGVCPDGEAMRGVNADGSVVCSGAGATATRFSSVALLDVGSDFHSMAIGSDGLPVLAYCDSTGTLAVAKCNDLACSGDDETISALGRACAHNPIRIRIGANGYPVISFASGPEIVVARCNDLGCAGGDETFTPLSGTHDSHPSLGIGIDGFPVFSHYREIERVLVVAKCDDFGCTGGAPTVTVVDDAGDVGQFTSIAIGTDGFPVISYHDATSFALKVVKCASPACAAAWPHSEITTVDDPATHVGLATSIAIGVDGHPVISYYDATAFTLKVAKCNDSACAGGDETITIVDDPSNQVGFFTSIAIGADGLPVVAYCDDSAHALKVAKCNDPACRSGDETITSLASGTFLTETLELAIGVDGLPVISFVGRSGSQHYLMVAKCANASCR